LLEYIEGAIKSGQSRETGNIGIKTRTEDNQNKQEKHQTSKKMKNRTSIKKSEVKIEVYKD
jgi:hypothetical protein